MREGPLHHMEAAGCEVGEDPRLIDCTDVMEYVEMGKGEIQWSILREAPVRPPWHNTWIRLGRYDAQVVRLDLPQVEKIAQGWDGYTSVLQQWEDALRWGERGLGTKEAMLLRFWSDMPETTPPVECGQLLVVTDSTSGHLIGVASKTLPAPPATDKRYMGFTSESVEKWILWWNEGSALDFDSELYPVPRAAVLSLCMLHVRNAAFVDAPLGRAWRRRAVREGRRSQVVSYDLIIAPLRRTLRSIRRHIQRYGPDVPIPYHQVRGHFKHFTEERPLFGRLVGVWWWDPYYRGNEIDGETRHDQARIDLTPPPDQEKTA